jgi:hypothetical protein
VLGIALLFNYYLRQLSWLLLAMIVFFTLLTGYSAITGKVTDCGCFGDAIKLTPWQSFMKDVVLLVLILIIFIKRSQLSSTLSGVKQIVYLTVSYTVAIALGIYCIMYLPIIDFLPYKPGNNIPALMQYPEGAARDSFETRMYYEKNGVTEEFTLKNYPWQDTTWQWVKTENVLIKEGYKPKIKDLRIADADGNDYSEDLINFPDYIFWVVTYDVQAANVAAFEKINSTLMELEKKYKLRAVGLTASNPIVTEEFRHELNAAYPYYYCDATALKTMVRANPGVLLIKNGNIIAKWSHRAMPSAAEMEKILVNE